jgi:hypothetical protein
MWTIASVTYGNEATVTVDAIIVNNKPAQHADLVDSAIEIPLNVPIARDQLKRFADQSMQRLQAMGLFEQIGILLKKGTERNHFIVEINLEIRSPLYLGTTWRRGQDKNDDSAVSSDLAILFFGTRDVFATGNQLEAAISQRTTLLENEETHLSGRARAGKFTFSNPRIGDGKWFSGTSILYLDQRNYQNLDLGGTLAEVKDHGIMKAGLIGIGRRFGLFSTTLSIGRATGKTRSTGDFGNSDWQWWNTQASVTGRFSDKTFTAAIEPGTEIDLTYDRSVAPELQSPQFRSSALHTFVTSGKHSISPRLIGNWSWIPVLNIDGERLSIMREVDLSSQFQYAWNQNMYFGTFLGRYFPVDRHITDTATIRNRAGLSFVYHTPHMIFDLSLRYGDPGLDNDHLDQAYLDTTRFAQ